jgi:2,4-dienoyl-CoA reductase-like NADH-dependent reductase (Old Yellow Enzyme family)
MGATKDLEIAKPLKLQCGLTLPNRLVKAAMAENLAYGNKLPNKELLALYDHWAACDWGMVLTGELCFLSCETLCRSYQRKKC